MLTFFKFNNYLFHLKVLTACSDFFQGPCLCACLFDGQLFLHDRPELYTFYLWSCYMYQPVTYACFSALCVISHLLTFMSS